MPNDSNQKDIIWKPSKHLPIRYPKANCKAKKAFVFEAILSRPKPGKTIDLSPSLFREAILYHVLKKPFYPYIVLFALLNPIETPLCICR